MTHSYITTELVWTHRATGSDRPSWSGKTTSATLASKHTGQL